MIHSFRADYIDVEVIGPGFGDFAVGSHNIQYVARDAAGNKAVCSMVIEVQGELHEQPQSGRRL